MGLRVGIDGRYLRDDHPGIARHLFHALRALAAGAAPDDTLFVLVDPRAPRTRLDPAALTGPGVRLIETSIAPRTLLEQLALPRLVARLGVDVFHAPYPFTALGCPVARVVTLYDLIALDARHGLRSPLTRALGGLALRRVARSAAAVLTLSHTVRAQLVARLGLPAARVSVCGAAVDPGFTPAPPEAVAATRRTLGLPGRFVLHVGGGKPHKNLARLRAAWRALGRDDVTLALAGGPDATRDEPRVVALGRVDESCLRALYSAAELLVVPSLDEGFGFPVLEAMACGTAVACARRGALGEVAGEAAAYFDPEDERAIASTVARLLDGDEERRALARRGLERARAFTWDDVAARTWAAYHAVARAAVQADAGARVADLGKAR